MRADHAARLSMVVAGALLGGRTARPRRDHRDRRRSVSHRSAARRDLHADLQNVKVVLCRSADRPGGCLWVNSRTAGTTRTTWFGFNAGTSAGNAFSLASPGCPTAATSSAPTSSTAPRRQRRPAHDHPVHRRHAPARPPRTVQHRLRSLDVAGRGHSLWQLRVVPGTPTSRTPPAPWRRADVRHHRRRHEPSRTNSSVRACGYYSTNANWADLATCATATDGERVAQQDLQDMTTLPPLSRSTSRAGPSTSWGRGHHDAWGLFNFPNDKQDAASRAVVLSCFAFYRLYGSGINDLSTLQSTRELSVETVDGGRCNNPALACYATRARRQALRPAERPRRPVLQPAAGQYNLVQFYRFVDGQRGTLSDPAAWDCTSSDPRDHWVSRIEFYRWSTSWPSDARLPRRRDAPVDRRPRSASPHEPGRHAGLGDRVKANGLDPNGSCQPPESSLGSKGPGGRTWC